MAQPHAVVVGGGIGGLTAAAALHDKGWAVTVCERSPAVEPVGAGLGVAPNGLRALDSIGLGDSLRALAVEQGSAGLRRRDGRWLLRTDADDMRRRLGDSIVVLPRSDLVDLLLSRLPATALHTATTVTSVEPGDTRQLARVGTTAGELTADLVVAADGLRSTTRPELFLEHPGPVYAGFTSWRFITSAPDGPISYGESWGRGTAFGMLPLPDGRVYCYATANAPAGERAADERAELFRLLEGWHDPIRWLLRSVGPESVLRTDVWHIDTPLPAYHKGRVALLGDAAHAMTPNLGQGACQAMEDAVVLAHQVSGSTAYVPVALASYTDARLARTSLIVQRSAQLAENVQSESALVAGLRDAGAGMMGRLAPRMMSRFLDPILDWHPPVEAARV
ncbi:FAD-dependent monooxygenase [Actinorugispora endophytica]|uniref:2-polyprenyl-6-methoxyphenol hydroxylase-like FAD-dependent oxidoreductase n=1 Tax=Actinorugispora endophytica TaxID=1605990 RepID=A0A4R6UXA6_9ACTN|nr:FAD-dependent monooxygenase [Actinorugispora endophytica]TDQ52012.1 2-polyprenyl-6-methoxyphenol hydroxylase-like FAD-dependent oxidoreductase [Actinorugispora endophytica]